MNDEDLMQDYANQNKNKILLSKVKDMTFGRIPSFNVKDGLSKKIEGVRTFFAQFSPKSKENQAEAEQTESNKIPTLNDEVEEEQTLIKALETYQKHDQKVRKSEEKSFKTIYKDIAKLESEAIDTALGNVIEKLNENLDNGNLDDAENIINDLNNEITIEFDAENGQATISDADQKILNTIKENLSNVLQNHIGLNEAGTKLIDNFNGIGEQQLKGIDGTLQYKKETLKNVTEALSFYTSQANDILNDIEDDTVKQLANNYVAELMQNVQNGDYDAADYQLYSDNENAFLWSTSDEGISETDADALSKLNNYSVEITNSLKTLQDEGLELDYAKQKADKDLLSKVKDMALGAVPGMLTGMAIKTGLTCTFAGAAPAMAVAAGAAATTSLTVKAIGTGINLRKMKANPHIYDDDIPSYSSAFAKNIKKSWKSMVIGGAIGVATAGLINIPFNESCTPSIPAVIDFGSAAPEVVTSEVEAPEVEAPEVEAPEVEAPELVTSEVEAPEVVASEVVAPEVEAPEVEAPEVVTPEVVTSDKISVQSGDSLYKIAETLKASEAFNGLSTLELINLVAEANDIDNPALIQAGSTLNVDADTLTDIYEKQEYKAYSYSELNQLAGRDPDWPGVTPGASL